MIDLDAKQLATVRGILQSNVPGIPAFAFGSRARGRAKRFSDLDLALAPDQAIEWRTLARLREAFEESDLSISVDVVDWSQTTPAFRAHAGPFEPLSQLTPQPD